MMRNQKSAFGLNGWLTTLLFQRWPKTGPRTGQLPYYMIEAFLEIQHLINLSFIEIHSNQDCFYIRYVTYRKWKKSTGCNGDKNFEREMMSQIPP